MQIFDRNKTAACLAAAVFLLAACGANTSSQTPTSPVPAAAVSPANSGEPTSAATLTIASPTQPSEAVVSPTAPPTAAPTTAKTVPPTLAAGTFKNPVFDQDFPDPDVLKVGDTYYAYATNSSDKNIQVAKSKDLVTWQWMRDALPKLPSWAVSEFGWAWAPEVSALEGNQGYVMYFVARFKMGTAGGTQCIGVATSEQPEGPFESPAEQPFICQTGQGGSIDPATFVDDDGKHYVLWKNDGNSGGGQTWLYIQPVSSDGQTLLEQPTKLITADQIWEGVLVEAPTMWKHKGKYYLFYSANAYNTPRYATGYAVADQLLGPYTKAKDPLLKTVIGAGIVGPGGQDIVIGPKGDEWILFHGWSGEAYRRMYLAPLTWEGDRPVVNIKNRDPLPAPLPAP